VPQKVTEEQVAAVTEEQVAAVLEAAVPVELEAAVLVEPHNRSLEETQVVKNHGILHCLKICKRFLLWGSSRIFQHS
jgi:hypothetical protein